MAFVQGFLASLIIDSVTITLFVTDFTFPRSRTSLDKSVMDGSGVTQMLPGLESGQLQINGHVDQSNLNALETTWAKKVTVSFTFTIEEGLLTDASYSGLISLSALEVGTGFDGNWSFSLSGDTSGVTTYTPSATV